VLTKLKGPLAVLVSCALLLTAPRTAEAQPLNAAATEIVIGLIAVGAALGIGIFYPARQPSSLTGCTVSAENDLQLRNEGDIRRLPLSGDLANGRERRLHPRVSGKRKKTDPN
jgi:hypothetical protein